MFVVRYLDTVAQGYYFKLRPLSKACFGRQLSQKDFSLAAFCWDHCCIQHGVESGRNSSAHYVVDEHEAFPNEDGQLMCRFFQVLDWFFSF